MALRCLPIISSDNYIRFQQLLPRELPKTYAEWLHDLQQEKLAIIQSGNVYLLIEVDPDNFFAYCSQKAVACSLEELGSFAWHSGHVGE